MNIGLTAEQNWLFIIPIIALAFGATYFFYADKNKLGDMPTAIRKALRVLRFMVLFVLGLLLISPILRFEKKHTEKPEVILLQAVDSQLTTRCNQKNIH